MKEVVATFREMVLEEDWETKGSFVVEDFSRVTTKVRSLSGQKSVCLTMNRETERD